MLLTLNNRNVNTINGSLVADNLTASTFLKCDADKKIVTYGASINPSDLTDYPSDGAKYLSGDGTWKIVGDSTGTANYVAVCNGGGVLFEERYLSNVRGGLGSDFVAVGNANELLSVNGNGDAYTSGKLVDANVASNAELARSKLAADANVNSFVLNDNSGAITSNSNITYNAGTGTASFNVDNFNVTATTITLSSTGPMNLGPVVKYGTENIFTKTFAVDTTDDTATTLVDFAPESNTCYYIKYTLLGVDMSSTLKSIVVKANAKVNCDNSGTVVFNNPPAELFKNVDTELAACEVVLASSAANSLTLTVTGLASHTLHWSCKAKIMYSTQFI